MPKAKTLTAEAVAGLGAERLAALLLEAAEHDTALLRSLRVAVASRVDASAVASEIDQQIRSVRRSTAFVDRQGRYAMEQNEIINQYTGYFGEQLLHVKGVSCPLYRKVLYVTMLDCLGRAAFPSVEKHRDRFLTFIDTCSGWTDKDRVSALQLILALGDVQKTSIRLYAAMEARVKGWGYGCIIRPDNDPMLDETLALAGATEHQIVKQARYVELLYTYRNHLVHEFRQPGYGMEPSDDPTTPYYHGMEGSSWELVFPWQFLHGLCDRCIAGLTVHLHARGLNPYDAYQFGTLWRRR